MTPRRRTGRHHPRRHSDGGHAPAGLCPPYTDGNTGHTATRTRRVGKAPQGRAHHSRATATATDSRAHAQHTRRVGKAPQGCAHHSCATATATICAHAPNTRRVGKAPQGGVPTRPRPGHPPQPRPHGPLCAHAPGEGGPRRQRASGFTLIELVIVIVLMGTVAAMLSSTLSQPIYGMMMHMQRAELTGRAIVPLRQMTREVRNAVPNTVRASANGQVLEFVLATRGAIYLNNRSTLVGGLGFDSPGTGGNPNSAVNCATLGTTTNCNVFYVVGDIRNGAGAFNARALVVANTGSASAPQAGMNVYAAAPRELVAATANAWEKAHTITPPGTTITFNAFDEDLNGGGNDGLSRLTVSLPGGATWQMIGQPMTENRVYFADDIVRYECTGGELKRFTYSVASIAAAIPATPAGGEVLLDNATCSFNATGGGGLVSAFDAGLVRLVLGTRSANGESVTLQREVFVENPP